MPSYYHSIVVDAPAAKAYEAIDFDTHAKVLGHVRMDQTSVKDRDVNNCVTGDPKAVGFLRKAIIGKGPKDFLVETQVFFFFNGEGR